MDLPSVADELYGLPPRDFTATRDERAAEARKTGERGLAAQIGRLHRPTLAAWANNLLVRAAPDQVDVLLRLGEGLRDAQRQLAGDELRELLRRRNVLLRELAGQARRLAADAGHPIGENVLREVEQTLHTVLADPEAAEAWAAGRLVKPLTSPTEFAGAGASSSPGSRSDRPRLRVVPGEAQEEPTARVRKERRRERRGELTRARREEQATARRAHEREEERRRAGERRDEAAARLREAEDRVHAIEDQLARARREAEDARTERDDAERRADAAEHGARQARSEADTAAATAARMEAELGALEDADDRGGARRT